MKLFNRIIENNELNFIDFSSNEQFNNVQSLQVNSELTGTSKKIVFLYVDNSITSVKILLHFLSREDAVVLLSNTLNDKLKTTLEATYKPNVIFDLKRDSINGFNKISHFIGITYLFSSIENLDHHINNKVKILLSTSGTTGSPKFVKLSEENLLENALSIIDYLPIQHSDITPLNLPIHYSYGLSILTTNGIKGGTIYCSVPDVLDKKFWTGLEEKRFTSIAGVPFVYEMLKRIGFTKRKYESLRYLTQAGGKLSNELVSHYADYATANDLSFFVMYGQTEATARISYLPPAELQRKIGSIGKPILNGSFTIDELNGELIYSGPNVFGGYAESTTDLQKYDDSTQLRTGDIGHMDDEGFYYITGRLKRFVKLFGNRINLDEIEQKLNNTFPISTFVCAGIQDKFLLIVYNNLDVNTQDVKDSIINEFNIHPSTLKIEYLQEIPLTQNGKVNYTEIINIYGTN